MLPSVAGAQARGVGRARSWTPVSAIPRVCACPMDTLPRVYPEHPFPFLPSAVGWLPGWF